MAKRGGRARDARAIPILRLLKSTWPIFQILATIPIGSVRSNSGQKRTVQIKCRMTIYGSSSTLCSNEGSRPELSHCYSAEVSNWIVGGSYPFKATYLSVPSRSPRRPDRLTR